ncbi:MAG: CHAT domain-containing protein [Aestuariibacter sp.]|nr:CHAT domain-containing protein [Aestuariibacter sp.]
MITYYQDFEVKITKQDNQLYVDLGNAPGGRHLAKRIPITVPDDHVAWSEACQGRKTEPELTTIGHQLFDSIITDQLANNWHACLGELRSQPDTGLRLRFSLQADALNQVPLELLCASTDPTHKVLALDAQTPIVRSPLHGGEPVRKRSIALPLRMLVIIANPKLQKKTDPIAEKASLETALADLVQSEKLFIDYLGLTKDSTADYSTFHHKLAQAKCPYDIVHFIGHGALPDADVEESEGVLLFVNPETGGRQDVHASNLAGILAESGVRIVVLQACDGARDGTHSAFQGVAQQFIAKGLPAVVAMQCPVDKAVATWFCGQFYNFWLAESGLPLERAMTEARREVRNRFALDTSAWWSPVLFIRQESTEVLRVNLESTSVGGENARVILGEGSQPTRLSRIPVFKNLGLVIFALVVLAAIIFVGVFGASNSGLFFTATIQPTTLSASSTFTPTLAIDTTPTSSLVFTPTTIPSPTSLYSNVTNIVIADFAQLENGKCLPSEDSDLHTQSFVDYLDRMLIANGLESQVHLTRTHQVVCSRKADSHANGEFSADQVSEEFSADLVIWVRINGSGDYDFEFFVSHKNEAIIVAMGLNVSVSKYDRIEEIENTQLPEHTQLIINVIQGLTEYWSGDLEKAIDRFDYVLASFARDGNFDSDTWAAIKMYKGRALAKIGEDCYQENSPDIETCQSYYQDALVTITGILRENPNYIWAHIGIGAIYYRQAVDEASPADCEMLASAQEEYEKAINAINQPTVLYIEAKAHYGIGNIHYIRSQLEHCACETCCELAKQEYEQALDVYQNQGAPNEYISYVYYGLGGVYRCLGNYTQAIAQYQECMNTAGRRVAIKERCRKVLENLPLEPIPSTIDVPDIPPIEIPTGQPRPTFPLPEPTFTPGAPPP